MSEAPMSVQELAAALQDRNLIRVSADTGIHLNTLYAYRRQTALPRYDNLLKLSMYLRETAGAER